MSFSIRETLRADAPLLPVIERSAGEAFLALPELAGIAADSVISAEEHATFVSQGDLLGVPVSWVAVDDEDAPVGFVIAEELAGYLHVWEVSVHRAMQGRGIGRALMAQTAHAATARGLPGVTLTTFRDVPWNQAFYASCGFRTLAADELTPALRDILEDEVRAGLPRARRCAMLRLL